MGKRFNRIKEVTRMRMRLERESYPRFHMFLLMLLTGVSGFIASFSFLQLGLETMWLRYLIAIGVAYIVFLGLLWLWLRTKAEDYIDIPDPGSFVTSGESHSYSTYYDGEGGSFGGGGASASFDDVGVADSISIDDGAADTVGDVVGGAASADELAIPLLLLIGFLALLLSSLWIVYAAPVLLAELLVDGVLIAGLYRHVRKQNAQHWVETALRRTAWPFLITAVVIAISGYGLQSYVPEAKSIGDVISEHNTAE